ncbi:hypothetical protein COV11_00815, partial [Candidatus Woesearchaeota archaeon CG10_big_fil_rev_8_21_14_0_10_30_7]
SGKNKLIDEGIIKEFVKKHSKKLNVKEPKIYSLNDANPMAYSITNLNPSIFISAGLSELLSKKEMESVLLHELYHHKNKVYFWKFSINLLRIFSPLATFISTSEPMKQEEKEADNYAINLQKTNKYLLSAKKKINKLKKTF